MRSKQVLSIAAFALLALSFLTPVAAAAYEDVGNATYVCTGDRESSCLVTASNTACGGDCVLVCVLKVCQPIRYQ